MNPSEFIVLAGKLAVRTKDDAAMCRTVTGRAYYGAFNIARDLLRSINVVVPNGGQAHGYIKNQLSGCKHLSAKQAGDLLGDLHSDRLRADYDLHLAGPETERTAKQSVEMAHQIQSFLEDCAVEPTKSTVKDEIKAYQEQVASAAEKPRT